MNCFICNRENTKYSCIQCKKPICNACSISSDETAPGYSEEEYRVGKCPNCSITKQKPKQQQNLSAFFKFSQPSTSGLSRSELEETTKKPSSSARSKKKSRSLTVETANNWRETSLATYLAKDWLIINADETGKNVASLNCSVCNKYAEQVKSMKQFSHSWAFEGSTNLRLTNAQDHAKGEPHRRALDLSLYEMGKTGQERSKILLSHSGDLQQQQITVGISKMMADDFEELKIKFDVAYLIAKEELPMSKYSSLLDMEERHGVKIGNAYRSAMSCSDFISAIGNEMTQQLIETLNGAKFFSVLSDGSNDVSITEKEAIFLQYLDTNPPGIDQVQVTTSFLKLADLKDSSASGVLRCMKKSLEILDIDENMLNKKWVGFAADGATVNRGTREGVIGLLQKNQPWIIYVWCIAHRLELSLKDALKGTSFDDVDDMLLRLYYLYENSPKKLRQLREIHDIYEQIVDFEIGGVRPKRASGKYKIENTNLKL